MFLNKCPLLNKLYYVLITFRQSAQVEYGPGVLNLLIKIYYSFIRMNRFEVFVFNQTSNSSDSSVGDRGISITDFSQLDKYRASDYVPKELCCDKMHLVTSCRIVVIDNELAYIHWIYTKGNQSRFIKLVDGVAEINNVLTFPRFRGQKIAAKELRCSAEQLRKEGYRKIVAVIHDQNIASIKSFASAGFVQTNVIRAWGPFHRKVSI